MKIILAIKKILSILALPFQPTLGGVRESDAVKAEIDYIEGEISGSERDFIASGAHLR